MQDSSAQNQRPPRRQNPTSPGTRKQERQGPKVTFYKFIQIWVTNARTEEGLNTSVHWQSYSPTPPVKPSSEIYQSGQVVANCL